MPQIFRLVTFLLGEAENDARGRLKRLKRFGTFEETHANLYVAHQAKKRRRGCVPSQKVAEVAGCSSKVARGPHQAKNFVKSRPRSVPNQKDIARGSNQQKSPFLGSPEETQRNDRIANQRKISATIKTSQIQA